MTDQPAVDVQKKPSPSMRESAMTYIADLAFASIVLLLFAGISRFIRHFAEGLNVSEPAESFVQLVALGFFCFGTLWCATFALEGARTLATSLLRGFRS